MQVFSENGPILFTFARKIILWYFINKRMIQEKTEYSEIHSVLFQVTIFNNNERTVSLLIPYLFPSPWNPPLSNKVSINTEINF